MAWTEDQERAFRARKQMWRISTLGMELFASIIGMFLLGWLIDYWVGTTNHVFKLVGLGVGFIGGFWNFFKEVKNLRANPIQGMDRKKATKASAAPPPPPTAGRPGPPPVPAGPETLKRPGRDPQLFAREHFTDEQLARIEEEGEIRWPEGFEASPADDLRDDLPDDLDEEDPKR